MKETLSFERGKRMNKTICLNCIYAWRHPADRNMLLGCEKGGYPSDEKQECDKFLPQGGSNPC